MQAPSPTWSWLDARESVTMAELAQVCNLSLQDIDELVAYGALTPLAEVAPQPSFSAQWVVPLRTASRLRLDLELDLFTVGLLLEYLNRIALLERELQALRARVTAT